MIDPNPTRNGIEFRLLRASTLPTKRRETIRCGPGRPRIDVIEFDSGAAGRTAPCVTAIVPWELDGPRDLEIVVDIGASIQTASLSVVDPKENREHLIRLHEG